MRETESGFPRARRQAQVRCTSARKKEVGYASTNAALAPGTWLHVALGGRRASNFVTPAGRGGGVASPPLSELLQAAAGSPGDRTFT